MIYYRTLLELNCCNKLTMFFYVFLCYTDFLPFVAFFMNSMICWLYIYEKWFFPGYKKPDIATYDFEYDVQSFSGALIRFFCIQFFLKDSMFDFKWKTFERYRSVLISFWLHHSIIFKHPVLMKIDIFLIMCSEPRTKHRALTQDKQTNKPWNINILWPKMMIGT